jgi:hypothetical protein
VVFLFSSLNSLSKYSFHLFLIFLSFTKSLSDSSLIYLTWLKFIFFFSQSLVMLRYYFHPHLYLIFIQFRVWLASCFTHNSFYISSSFFVLLYISSLIWWCKHLLHFFSHWLSIYILIPPSSVCRFTFIFFGYSKRLYSYLPNMSHHLLPHIICIFTYVSCSFYNKFFLKHIRSIPFEILPLHSCDFHALSHRARIWK